MKIRTDFVTNSSSSSFIIARKEELSENLKNTIIDFFLDQLMGEKVFSSDSTEEQLQEKFEEWYISEEHQTEIRRALKEGKDVYIGCFSYECAIESYADLYEEFWDKLTENGGADFEVIDGDLTY